MAQRSRRAAIIVATPILASGIFLGVAGAAASTSPRDNGYSSSGISASESHSGRDHGLNHVAPAAGRDHGPGHVAPATGRDHGPNHVRR
jgi:hypothetical protein